MAKPTKYVLPEQTLQEHYFGIQHINRLQVKWNFFPNGYNNYNEIEFPLASIEVLNSKITQNLSQLNANRCILFLIMYILHFNWIKSYIY